MKRCSLSKSRQEIPSRDRGKRIGERGALEGWRSLRNGKGGHQEPRRRDCPNRKKRTPSPRTCTKNGDRGLRMGNKFSFLIFDNFNFINKVGSKAIKQD